jgi:hypothetical protein
VITPDELEQIKNELRTIPISSLSAVQGAWAHTRIAALTAEIDRLHSWDGLMSLLDERWPEDIFPTLPFDATDRDPVVRIVTLLRWVDRLTEALGNEREERQMADARVKELEEAERFDNWQKHFDAWADSGDGYTYEHGYRIKCLWCPWETMRPFKAEAMTDYDKHVENLNAAAKHSPSDKKADE